MMIFGLSILDIAIIVIYFCMLVVIGFWAMKRIKSPEDFFLAGRRFGKFIQTFAAFGQATSVETGVSVTTATVSNGASGIWAGLNLLFATPVYWMTSPWYRRLRLLTLGDFFKDRYGSKRMAGVYAIVQSVFFMLCLALGFNAMSKTIMAMVPKSINELTVSERIEYDHAVEFEKLESADYLVLSDAEQARLRELRIERPRMVFSYLNQSLLIFVVCGIVLIYTVAGGLEAAFITDAIQGVLTILLSVLLLPFAWMSINKLYGSEGVLGGFQTLHERIPASFFEVFGSPHAIDFTWYYIVTLCVMATLNVAVNGNQLTALGSAKNEYAARFGFTCGLYLKRVCTIVWGVFGLAAILLYSGKVHDPDLVWGYGIRDLLGPLNIGLVGLMIACLMAALMSTADCLMITSSGLLTHNLYREYFSDKPEGHYVKVGRIFGAVTVIGGALLALYFSRILDLLKLLWEINAIFAAAFWLGILWRRAHRKAAWASVLTALFAFFLLPLAAPLALPGLRTDTRLAKMTQPAPLTREYKANEGDFQLRQREIEKWDNLNVIGRTQGPRPQQIVVGQKFSKTYQPEERSVFWTEGVKVNNAGEKYGRGRLDLDLLIVDSLGFDLSKNTHALNETIRLLFRIILPFTILFLLGRFLKSENEPALDRFYAKMKTPVCNDREEDRKELELSFASPHRFDHLKMLPNSNFEFCRWDKTDIIGFSISLAVAFLIFIAFFLVVSIGS